MRSPSPMNGRRFDWLPVRSGEIDFASELVADSLQLDNPATCPGPAFWGTGPETYAMPNDREAARADLPAGLDRPRRAGASGVAGRATGPGRRADGALGAGPRRAIRAGRQLLVGGAGHRPRRTRGCAQGGLAPHRGATRGGGAGRARRTGSDRGARVRAPGAGPARRWTGRRHRHHRDAARAVPPRDRAARTSRG